jgi:hypothetical protein
MRRGAVDLIDISGVPPRNKVTTALSFSIDGNEGEKGTPLELYKKIRNKW